MSSREPESPAASSTRTRLLLLAIMLVSLAYIAQIATPLRLINDGIDYLLQASSALDGDGFLVRGVRSMRPPGYPAMIFLLSRLGMGTSWALVALNCLAMAVGCWASQRLLRACCDLSRDESLFISLFTLLSFVMVRNATYPLSDTCFFGASALCLLALNRSERESGRRRIGWLIGLIPWMLFCIELRTIGVVLVAAFLWVAIGGVSGATKIYLIALRHRWITFIIFFAAAAALAKILFDSRYLRFNLPIFLHRGLWRSIAGNLVDHTTEWGEMTVNAPISKLPAFLAPAVRIIGALSMLACLAGLWSRRKQPDSLMLYVVGSSCIVLAYPWFDTRLWLPLVPFLMGYAVLGLRSVAPPRILGRALVLYGSLFCLLGLAGLAYSTRLTFSGPRFPDLYGDGHLRATYKLALRGELPSNENEIDPDALYLLRRYEWRASRP